MLRAGGVQVFAVGLTAALDRERGFISQSRRDKSVALLEKLTSETGGRVYFAETVGQLKEAVEEISKSLHSEYVVGYEAPGEGKHKVEVKAFAAGGSDGLKVVLRPEPVPMPEDKKKKKKDEDKKRGEDKKKDYSPFARRPSSAEASVSAASAAAWPLRAGSPPTALTIS